jgi:hypothetical protein
MVMCHMLADTLDELHAMADRIGASRGWFQVSNSGVPHYDIPWGNGIGTGPARREWAIAAGAVVIDRRQTVVLMRRLRGERQTFPEAR